MNWGQVALLTVACTVAMVGIAIIFDVPPKKLFWALIGSAILILAVPAAFIITGLVIWIRRRRR